MAKREIGGRFERHSAVAADAQNATVADARQKRAQLGRVWRPERRTLDGLTEAPTTLSGRAPTPKRRIPESSQSFPKTLAAIAYAERLHAGQRRQADGAPFIVHPLEVCCLLYHAGAPDHVIAAGVLHDIIEKTDANTAELQARFGLPIATLVLAVSEDQRILGYAQRKAALREQVASAGHEALMVFAADKISKARELGLEREQTCQSRLQPALVRAERDRKLAHYRHCLDLLEQLLTDSPLVTQLQTELENLPGISNGLPLLPGAVCR
jgi:hypothetical protein